MIPGYYLELRVYDTLSTGAGTANASIHAAIEDRCVGVVGDALSTYSQQVQYILQNFGIPQVSPMSTATGLSDKKLFPTFLRTIPADNAAGPKVAETIRYFNWSQVGLIVGSDSYSTSLYQSFLIAAQQNNITITVSTFLEAMNPDYFTTIKTIKNAFTQVNVLFAEQIDSEEVIKEAHKQHVLGDDFVWIGADTMHLINLSTLPPNALQGSLIVSPAATADTPLATSYFQQMARLNITDAYGGFIYDALFLYATAFNTLLNGTTVPDPWENSRELLNTLLKANFLGVSGQVSFFRNGDRIPYGYDVQYFKEGGAIVTGASISQEGHLKVLTPFIWSDGSTNVPLDYLHILRETPPTRVKVVFYVLAIMMLVIVSILLGVFLYVMRTKDPDPKLGHLIVHVSHTIGGIFGYTAIILIVGGVSKVHCTAAAVLFDLSLLICGGVLSFRTLRKFAVEYHDHTKASIISPKVAKYSLFGLWGLLITLNVVVLIATMSYKHPDTALHLLEQNIYEYQCRFGSLAIIILPITIGALYFFSLFTTLIKILINTAVATKKNDIQNGVNNIVTLFALGIAAITLALIDPTQTQIDITICIVILLANMSVPSNIISWLLSPKRSILSNEPPPNREPARPKSQSTANIHLSHNLSSSSTPILPHSTSSPSPSSSTTTIIGKGKGTTSTGSRLLQRDSLNAADLNQI